MKKSLTLRVSIAALLISGAAIFVGAQERKPAVKQNTRERQAAIPPVVTTDAAAAEAVSYSYEFTKPEFYIRHIVLEHDGAGRGKISFERQGDLEPIVEPIELSESSRARITALWAALRFLDSDVSYQSEKQFPQLGTMRLGMQRGLKTRTAEFNWTHDPGAKALVDEYRRAANQAIFIFDITLARQNQPLNSPKLMDQLDKYVARGELSDPQQLVPLLRELTTDERIPLMARNHAGRILKKLEK
ncbi:MAG TPA: hypothetical protein VF723_08930 [Pyrinomonadaceae bacterium]|jgi:hypothetical protein